MAKHDRARGWAVTWQVFATTLWAAAGASALWFKQALDEHQWFGAIALRGFLVVAPVAGAFWGHAKQVRARDTADKLIGTEAIEQNRRGRSSSQATEANLYSSHYGPSRGSSLEMPGTNVNVRSYGATSLLPASKPPATTALPPVTYLPPRPKIITPASQSFSGVQDFLVNQGILLGQGLPYNRPDAPITPQESQYIDSFVRNVTTYNEPPPYLAKPKISSSAVCVNRGPSVRGRRRNTTYSLVTFNRKECR